MRPRVSTTLGLPPALERAAWVAGVAGAYFLAAKLGLTVATVGVTVTLVWPLSGVAVAAMLLLGPRVWPGVGATIGVAGLVFAGVVATSGMLAAWLTWWGRDAMGILLVTPLITALATFLVFGGLLPSRATAPLVYVAFPLLMWAALSFEQRGAATGSVVLAGLAVWWTSRGAGAAIVRERSRADAGRSESLIRERAARREAESASRASPTFWP